MSRDGEVGLRQAVQSESTCGGQGYAKNATVQPVANNVGQTDVNVSIQV